MRLSSTLPLALAAAAGPVLFVVEFPRLAAHRALLVSLRVEPLYDAVHVEAVRTGPPN